MRDSLRLKKHPVLGSATEKRRRTVILVDGQPLETFEGEMLAAALWANGLISLGRNHGSDTNRGMYCGVGHCYECRVTVNGVEDVRSCLVPVREGMQITLQGLDVEKKTNDAP